MKINCPYRSNYKLRRVRIYFVFVVSLLQTRIVCRDWKRKGKRGLGGRRSSVILAKIGDVRIIRYFRCVRDCNDFFVAISRYCVSIFLVSDYFVTIFVSRNLDLAYSHDLCTTSQKTSKISCTDARIVGARASFA